MRYMEAVGVDVEVVGARTGHAEGRVRWRRMTPGRQNPK